LVLALLGVWWQGALVLEKLLLEELVLEKLVVAEWAVVLSSRLVCELWLVYVSFDRPRLGG
jgi:hypothetical protein